MADGRKGPNRPIRPRGGPGGRKRRVVIEGGGGRSAGRQARDRSSAPPQPRQAPAPPPSGPVTVESGVTVKDLSQALGVPMGELIKILMGLGQMRTATQSLSDEEVELIAAEVGREITIKHAADEEELLVCRCQGADLVASELAHLLEHEASKEVEAGREHILALGRQGEDVARPSGGALGLLGLDEAVALEADEVLAGGHGGKRQRPGGFLDGRAAGSF
jgi:translation initiation factor IF-2